jgi:ribonuclease BN (tRNA processing enzyme)
MSLLTLLGTGTCQIELARRASSVLLELDQTCILFDCGHGVVQRLLEAGIRHDQVQHIVLSHFHPDHVSDLIPFLQAGAWSRRDRRTSDVHIYGPAGVHEVINGLMQLFKPTSFQQPDYRVVVHELAAGPYKIDGLLFEAASLPPAGNHGLRFRWHERRYALTGDSYFHAEEIAFLKNVDLAVIDAGHIEDDEIVELAVQSQPRQLVCSHLYREIDAHKLQQQAQQKGYTGTILVGRDLMSFVL